MIKIVPDIDAYIYEQPEANKRSLNSIRSLIRSVAPEAQECINYGIPTFKLNGNLVHFAAYKSHIGFYPGASGIAAFANELSAFKTSKGTVQFSNDNPLPLDHIRRIVEFRIKENAAKPKAKAKPKK